MNTDLHQQRTSFMKGLQPGDRDVLVSTLENVVACLSGKVSICEKILEEKTVRRATISTGDGVGAYSYTPDCLDIGYSFALTNGNTFTRALVRDGYRRDLVLAITNSVDGQPVAPLGAAYDGLRRLTARNADVFGYNARSEVISAMIASNLSNYAYDSLGNCLTNTAPAVTNLFAPNGLNQYASLLRAPAPPRAFAYDADGNLLTDGALSCVWDAENRLVAVYSNALCVVSNAYDHLGRRVLKVTPADTRAFLYDGWNLVRETVAPNDPSAATGSVSYVWGKDLSGAWQGAGGVGGLLAVRRDGTWFFPLYGNNGDITEYVDENGAVVAHYACDAFGRAIAQSGSLADSFRFRFSTKYYDAETGLYYYGYRYYAPELMRWISRDPIEEGGGENLYEFCRNSPSCLCDSIGQTPTGDSLWTQYEKYSYNAMDPAIVWKTVGGTLRECLWPLEEEKRGVLPPNTCATRLIMSLAQIPGSAIPRSSRDYVNLVTPQKPGIAGNYIVNARKMGVYLRHAFGLKSSCSTTEAYYFKAKAKAQKIDDLRKEIEEKIRCEPSLLTKYVAVVVSTTSGDGDVSGHVAVVTKQYADVHTPYTDSSDVWILPPTKTEQGAKR